MLRITNLIIFLALSLHLFRIYIDVVIPTTPKRPKRIEGEFVAYVQEFKNHAAFYNVKIKDSDLSVNFVKTLSPFSNLAGETAARCFYETNDIEVSQKIWDILDLDSRKILLFHELAHCMLKRDHTSDFIFVKDAIMERKCPYSIMFPNVTPISECWHLEKDRYISELFKNPRNYGLIGENDESFFGFVSFL